MNRTIPSLLLPFLLAFALTPNLGQAQSGSSSDVNRGLYGKLGVGFSDYTGDFPIQTDSHPFDFQEFKRGSGFPFLFDGELGYQFSPKWALAAGFQGGNYPIVGYAGSRIDDSWRYTPHLLARYTFGTPGASLSFYLDAGVNATFGGDDPPTSIGYGPSVGGGVDFPLSSGLSFFVESRFHGTLPDDAIDGSDNGNSFIDGMDSVNQLLGFGLKFSLTSPVPPQIMGIDGPTSVQTGESATYTATVNEDEAERPLSYQWQFGDGGTDSGLTASHTYTQPGTYTVTFRASNSAGEARESITVEATAPPVPAQITSINVKPNPVDEGETVRFSSNVQGDSPLSREWSFGDGATSMGESPTHSYDEPGQYTVRLQVSNEAGEDARTVTVRVNRVLPEICTSVRELNSIFFESNSSTLTDEAEQSLQENADILSQCPNLRVRIEGFAAPGERNAQSLSEDRAEAVADFYQDNGVPSSRIATSGQGEVTGVTSKKGGTREYRRVDSIPEADDEE